MQFFPQSATERAQRCGPPAPTLHAGRLRWRLCSHCSSRCHAMQCPLKGASERAQRSGPPAQRRTRGDCVGALCSHCSSRCHAMQYPLKGASERAQRCGPPAPSQCAGASESALSVFSGLLGDALLLGAELGSERLAKVVGLKDLADLDLAVALHGIGAALDPLDGLIHGLNLPQPEAGDQLFGLGEGPVDHGPLAAREPDPRTFRAGLQPFAGEHHAGLHELFVVLAHLGQQPLARQFARLRLPGCLDHDHHAHRRFSLSKLSALHTRRTTFRRIDTYPTRRAGKAAAATVTTAARARTGSSGATGRASPMRTVPSVAPTPSATRTPIQRPAPGCRWASAASSAMSVTSVPVTYVVVTPATASRRPATLWMPIAAEDSAMSPSSSPLVASGPASSQAISNAASKPSSTPSTAVTLEGQCSLRSPMRPPPTTQPPRPAPAANPRNAAIDRSASSAWPWPIARPSNTRLPVMLAVKTRPRPR